ncbi:NB-ARC domain-containing protein [Favolaschia claudopus]|uniref:NB-ARC domain-containing protein n=1 Tax=Favolaschia claudopus TaxID=2862362 RepID=A0AAW0BQ35_9AGAR
MHPNSAATTSLEQILQYTNVTANALREASIATETPFLISVSALTLKIVSLVQNIKIQRERYLRIVEWIHQVLCTLTSLCVDGGDVRSPRMLEEIARYAGTLEKLQSCLRAQRELGTLKRLFKQSEITAQLDQCEQQLKVASQNFMITSRAGATNALEELGVDAETMHQELLELISAQSVYSDEASTLHRSVANLSSESFSLLPASPKLFYGRESELDSLVHALSTQDDKSFARIAVLGPGGMGKTTLAMATLHHPLIIDKFGVRHFISCESANSCGDLAAAIALHLGLAPSRQLSNAVMQHLKQLATCLIVLDNFETPWEAAESRDEVEEFLSLVAGIPNVALLVTMRGAERPGKVKWTRPFFPQLQPLPSSAARQIFLDIADDPDDEEESALSDLLDLSGNLPLAISLMASIVSLEGYSGTLSRWQIENVSLLSDGNDKRSNLEKSITLSLTSPRIASSQQAKDLLGLLSILPDGIRAEDILASHVPIPDVRQSQTLLLRTSLAYLTPQGRLAALSPIREFIRRAHPPSPAVCVPLRRYFQDLLVLWKLTRSGVQLSAGNLASTLAGHLGNITQLFLEGLITEDKSQLQAIGDSIITLDSFSMVMNRGNTPLFPRLPHLVQATGDQELRWKYGRRCLSNSDCFHKFNEEPNVWIADGARYFETGTRSVEEAVKFYNTVALHHTDPRYLDIPKATHFNALGMAVAEKSGDAALQLMSLDTEFDIAHRSGDRSMQLKIIQKAKRVAFANFGLQVGEQNLNFVQCDWLQNEAVVCIYMGDLSRAEELCVQIDELLVACEMQGSDRYLALLDIRAEVHYRKTEYEDARSQHWRIVQATSATTDRRHYAASLAFVAYLDILLGGSEEDIQRNLDAAEAVYTALGGMRILLCSFVRACLRLQHGEKDGARTDLLNCLMKTRRIYQDIHGYCLEYLSDPKQKLFGSTETFQWAVVSLAFFVKKKDPVGSLNSLRRLADTLLYFGEEETALCLFQVGMEGATEMGIHRLEAECMGGIANIEKRGAEKGAL